MRTVHSSLVLVVLVLTAANGRAQQAPQQQPSQEKAAPSVCDRSVDDYLADLARSKKKKATHNPLPTDVCLLGLCKEVAGPTNHPPKDTGGSASDTEAKNPSAKPQDSPPGESSSKRPAEEIGVPPENTVAAQCDPQQAAQDVEVGDYYFSQKSYKPALNRYRLALQNKPNDAAIHLRLARTYEKLKDNEMATSNYRSVLEHSDPQSQRVQEAQAALNRLGAAGKK